jgi:NADH:ubiquinone oxidoreductase subunit 5 (subunit L)/multisubunit Na+/H+ antiporter MnhA subunit
MLWLLAGAILLPLVAGVGLLVAGRRLSLVASHWTCLATACVVALCLLGLLPFAGQVPPVAITWLPGMGAMALHLGVTGLCVAAATAWAAVLVLLGTTSRETFCAPTSGAVMLIALAAAAVAYTAGHFLLRYVALEMVALVVALVPLIEVRGERGAGLTRLVYLLFRVADAGLLAAILILFAASGTFDIGPALEAGQGLDQGLLEWTVLGLVIAVWVKVGGWPFSLWARAGGRLGTRSRAWTYATVMPTLGIYLLYRVTPLIARAELARGAALWIGAGGAVVAVLLALAQTNPRVGIVFVCSAQGGLALLLAATGSKTTVWLSALVMTPLRLLLYLVADAWPSKQHKARAGLILLGGGALTAWSLLSTYWARAAGAPWPMLVWGEAAVGLLAVWTATVAWGYWMAPGEGEYTGRNWLRWGVPGILAVGLVVVGAAAGPVLHGLAHLAHGDLPADPALPSVLRYLATASAMWGVGVLVLVAWVLRWPLPWLRPFPGRRSEASHSLQSSLNGGEGEDRGQAGQLPDLEATLIRTAQTLRSTVEAGALERAISEVDRVVLGTAHVTRRVVEQRFLEDMLRRLAGGTARGARTMHRIIEQDGLEGLLRAIVRATFGVARIMQRWHSGKLRRNLLWIAICLALAVWLVWVGW